MVVVSLCSLAMAVRDNELIVPRYQVWSGTKDKEYRQRLVFNSRLQLIKNSTIIVGDSSMVTITYTTCQFRLNFALIVHRLVLIFENLLVYFTIKKRT